MPHSLHLRLPNAPGQVERSFLKLGDYPHPTRSLTVNSRYIELDGEPWLPVMGEFHYSRYPADEWAPELRKMRAGGVSIVASYIFWNHHEAIEGQFDWSGQRDLRRFVQLAAEAGLYVYLRPGPWVHAESRYGGFPDWLVARGGELRCNDPAYLASVARFYEEIGAQVTGLLWRDRGPVIGAQLENEYDRLGPGCGAEHISELKRLAIAAGIQVPLYTVTGWPTLDIPPHDVVPVSGAYADGFWQGSASELPPSGVFVFNTDRAIGEMGNVGGTPADGRIDKTHYPFFLAEAGGGMHVSYHRRPAVSADDLTATTLVQIGSGATLYGYYMYHGGTNPEGPAGRVNETQGSGYPNDVPVLGYDFRAPLGQYGQTRPSYGRLRSLHLFLESFGATLAPMEAVLPEGASVDAADRAQLRVAARGANGQGFVFINNHVRHYPMPDFSDVQLVVDTGTAEVTLPPVNIPSGAYAIWPVACPIGAATLRHATVQPLTRWEEGERVTWVGFTHPDIPAELCFEADTVQAIEAPGLRAQREGEGLVLRLAPTTTAQKFSLTDAAGVSHTLLILPRSLAEQASRVRFQARERIAFHVHALHQEGEALVATVCSGDAARLALFPGEDLSGTQDANGFASFELANPQDDAESVAFTLLEDCQEPAPVRLGPHIPWRTGPVPLAPDDVEFERAQRIRLQPPAASLAADARLLLEVDYIGDAARLYADGKLVDDNFNDGEPWYIGIDRFVRDGAWPELELRILAARPDLPIFIEAAARERLRGASKLAELRGIKLSVWRNARLVPAQ
ncbi:beta-galactosidase [Niveibacterium sp. SC-1]|uniref:beta-galactosidase n=1 Tax=Niveibacterium sp. SC-1 TaxID=3135646 RepID=UPI00311FB5FE